MQTLNRTIECTECGCLSFPDATLCPRCGAKYIKKVESNYYRDVNNVPSEFSMSKFNDVNELMWWSSYQFSCPIHGNISVKASVISPSIKCPFCH